MKVILLIILFVIVYQEGISQTTLFQQDFAAGGVPANYVDAVNPGTTKFTDIAVTAGTNATTTMAITNSALEFFRVAGSSGQGRTVRALDFSPVPTSLYIQFSFDASEASNGLSANATSAATFYVGTNNAVANSFANNGSSPNLNETFAKIGFNFVKVGNAIQWQLRNIGAATNSANFVGKHLITLVCNRTGSSFTYVRPYGVSGLETLSTNKWAAWVDGTKVFDEISATDATVELRRFKFIFDGGIGYVRLDDFLLRDVSGALPVTVADFRGSAIGSQVNLNWQAPEQVAATFTIERSADARHFTPIGSVQTATAINGHQTYTFTDVSPLVGANYYRLRQSDDASPDSFSKIVVVTVTGQVPSFTVLNNPITAPFIAIQPERLDGATYVLTTLTGQPLRCQQRETPDGRVTLLAQHPLPSGVYLLTATTGAIRLSRRVLVP